METSLKNILKVSRVLYIDEKKEVPKNIQSTLNIFFKKVYYVSDINEAIEIYNTSSPEIIISEVHVNEKSCLPLLHNIREYNHSIPILVISANKKEEVLFEAIRLHLVDFLVKPIKIDKFIFSLNNIAKYILKHGNVIVHFSNNYVYDYISKIVIIDKTEISLTKNESKLLELLLANENKLISKEEIEFHIWGEEFVSDSAFKSLFKRIRNKIGKNTIKNSSGHGYHLN